MTLCPLCNGLNELFLSCPNCGEILEDQGMLESFLGPYSPYLDEEILNQVDGIIQDECIHLFYCPHCGYDQRYVIKLI